MTIEPLGGIVYQGLGDFEDHLRSELETWDETWGPFYHAAGPKRPVFWTVNQWLEPFKLHFDSISEAAKALRGIQRNWSPCPFTQFRRAELIKAKLPPIVDKPKQFPDLVPESPMGAWTLLDEHTMLASARCASPFPGGLVEFQEDKLGPPSRAYLKLQEALTRARRWPGAGDVCLDAGATPGGWTWVLAGLGAQVTAVDRAPLDDRILALPNVRYLKHDAFTLTPEELGRMDWIFSDVICYPKRLFEWVSRWLDSGLCDNFICTIKMQGEPDFETTRLFSAIPGSSVVHLNYNKHELTWIRQLNK